MVHIAPQNTVTTTFVDQIERWAGLRRGLLRISPHCTFHRICNTLITYKLKLLFISYLFYIYITYRPSNRPINLNF